MIGAPTLVPVLSEHRFDEDVLCRYLSALLPGVDGALDVKQFQGGQSNPTYMLTSGDARYAECLFTLARSWREAAPIGCRDFARDAWNTRAAANRLMHWAVAGALLGPLRGDDGDWLGREIGLHGLFVRDNLELDLKGNHLFRDAVALVFANDTSRQNRSGCPGRPSLPVRRWARSDEARPS